MELPISLHIMWIVVASGLVLVMQGGFMCLETGLTRSKNSINVALKNVMDLAVAILAFWAIGFALMFGTTAGGWFGTDRFFGSNLADPFQSAFFLFQALFCGTAVTIVSGAVAERLSFRWYLIMSAFLAGIIYPLLGHWAWNGLDSEPAGWLALGGFVDWAGSTVVHSAGGWFALAILLIIGPREGRFEDDGTVNSVTGSNLTMVALGAVLLWFGWFGFNAGSTLAIDERIGLISLNTSMAAAAGGFAALGASWARSGRPRFQPAINGLLAGLVAITANCHAVDQTSAIMIGAIGGIVCMAADEALLKLQIDDAVGAVPVHLAAGIWGTLAVGLFGKPELLGTGLSRIEQLAIHANGVLMTGILAFALPLAVFGLLNRFWRLRVSPEEERIGLNVSEHGARTELFDFVGALTEQEKTGDIRIRVPGDPFTEIGQIAGHYNKVMDKLEEALAQTDGIVRTSTDAILMVEQDNGAIVFHNPVAEQLFELSGQAFAGRHLADLIDGLDAYQKTGGLRPGVGSEVTCRTAGGWSFPAEMAVTELRHGGADCLIVTLRDVTERRRAEAALRASEARFRSVYQHAAFGLAVMDGSGRLIEANPALSGMLASGVEVLRDQLLTDITHPEDSEDVADAFRRFAETRTDEEKMEVRLTCGNGLVMWARLLLTTAPGENEGPPLIIGLVEDITENRKTSAALHLAASVFENTQESIVIFDANGSVERVNRAYCRSSGYTDREVSGLDLSHLTSARYERDFFDGIERELAKAGVWQGEILIRRKSGELIPSWASLSVVRRSDGGIQNFVGILTDLTERKEKEEAIWRHANFDQVTSLPNRRLFQDRLNQAINQTGRRGGRMALFFLDLDRFKQVNDTLGHQAGDILLNRVAKRLLRAVRTTDTVARLGGDEFTVIVENVHEPEDLSRIAQGIIAEVARTVSLPGGEIKVSTSIGIAVYPDDGADSEELIRNADAALYHAKDRGRDNYQFFTEDLKDRLTRRIAFEHSLRQAIDTDQLFVHYQPQVEAVTGALCGAEALVRWRREDGSIGMPDDFIGLAEETGIIVALGQAVLKRVAEDMSQWSRDGHILPRIGVNVSARQFSARQRLPDLVEEIFEANGTPLDRLTIEITESSLMTDRETVLPQLVHLANKGVKVALDDFGKGYSSLSRLKNLPIQALKMDKDFVDGLPDDPESLAMATAILGMARGLGIDVIAEGVELKAQAQCLTDLGCHHFQGYLFARPMNATDFLSFCQSKAR